MHKKMDEIMEENMKEFVKIGSKVGMEEEDAPSSAFLAGLLGLPGCFIPGTPKILLICIVALILSILIIGKYCDKNKDRKGIIFLCRGASSLSFTIIFFLEGICVMLYIIPDGKKLYTTVLVILVYVIVMISYIFLMKHLIKRGAFRENGKATVPVYVYILGVMLLFGASAFKLRIKQSENAEVLMMIMLGLFFLSLVFMIGATSLIKYHYYKKIHK